MSFAHANGDNFNFFSEHHQSLAASASALFSVRDDDILLKEKIKMKKLDFEGKLLKRGFSSIFGVGKKLFEEEIFTSRRP